MTEVPEHLLQRTRDRRLALGLPVAGGEAAPAGAGAGAGAATATTATAGASEAAPAVVDPAVASAIAEAPPTEVEVAPRSPAVVAAESRMKAPWWAVTALVALPLWGFLYLNSLERPVSEPQLLAAGRVLYDEAGCSGCHGAEGQGGGAGPSLQDVHTTFPDPARMGLWIRLGSAGWAAAYPGAPYGADGRQIGDTLGPGSQMPSHAVDKLGDEELLELVMFIRLGLNDAALTAEPVESDEPTDAIGDYEVVTIDEEGLPIVDPEDEFKAIPDAGAPLWADFIAADGGDLVLE